MRARNRDDGIKSPKIDKIRGAGVGKDKAPAKAQYIALSQWDKRKKQRRMENKKKQKIILIYLSR